jgi:hypothetical protein
MGSGPKWIRSIKENPAGKVVSEPNGNRWEWDATDTDETGRLLRRLQNDKLAIEQSDIVPALPKRRARAKRDPDKDRLASPSAKPLKRSGSRDAAGGFNPYDNAGKPRRR